MDIVVHILNALARKHWPKFVHILLATLAGAVICPIVVIFTALGEGYAPGITKFLAAVILLGIPAILFYRADWNPKNISRWWYVAIPSMVITAVILLLGISNETRPMGIALGLIINTVAILIVGVCAFSQRFLYAMTEAASSAKIDYADSEVEAKKVFRVALAILAWEWFGAWYLVTFSPQLTITTGIAAILSLGIIVFTSYSLGFSGKTGQKILMYSAAAAFTIISLVLVDRAIESEVVSKFLLGGYLGSALKNQSKIGIVGWITIIVLMDLMSTTISWALQEKVKNKVIRIYGLVLEITLVVYLVGNWIVSTGFSVGDSIRQLSLLMDPYTTDLPPNIQIPLILGAVVGVIGSSATTVICIKKADNIPARSVAVFILCALVLYQLVFK